MIKMSCADTTFSVAMLSTVGTFYSLFPLSLIFVSHRFVEATMLRIQSLEGKKKAFNTCSSHVTVVSLLFGPVISMYMQSSATNPQHKNNSPLQQLGEGVHYWFHSPWKSTHRNGSSFLDSCSLLRLGQQRQVEVSWGLPTLQVSHKQWLLRNTYRSEHLHFLLW